MAKKRGFKRKVSRSFRGFRKRASKGGSSENLMVTMAAAAAYGAVRPKIETAIAPYTSKIPIGGAYVDELALGTVGYLLARGKIPMLKGKTARSVGKAVLIIEAARIGSGVSSGLNF